MIDCVSIQEQTADCVISQLKLPFAPDLLILTRFDQNVCIYGSRPDFIKINTAWPMLTAKVLLAAGQWRQTGRFAARLRLFIFLSSPPRLSR